MWPHMRGSSPHPQTQPAIHGDRPINRDQFDPTQTTSSRTHLGLRIIAAAAAAAAAAPSGAATVVGFGLGLTGLLLVEAAEERGRPKESSGPFWCWKLSRVLRVIRLCACGAMGWSGGLLIALME
jgi:hypothetical protein